MDKDLCAAAKSIRLRILEMAAKTGEEGKREHIASSLSMTEILTVLFKKIIRPDDVFVLSKGHGGMAYYAALREVGILADEQIDTFQQDGTIFLSHPSKNIAYTIAFSSGSLGMGLSYACGLAVAAKRLGSEKHIYVLLGDGELNEGSNWESVMFAKHQKLDNITAVVDNNKFQLDGACEEVLNVNLKSAFEAHEWTTLDCDGHSVDDLVFAFNADNNKMPKAIIADTVKGKGISFMEGGNTWHHNRLSDEFYQKAVSEVTGNGI